MLPALEALEDAAVSVDTATWLLLEAELETAWRKRPLIDVEREFAEKHGLPYEEVRRRGRRWHWKKRDPVGFQNRLERTALQQGWRPKILARDGGACRACGSSKSLELAHITPVQRFMRPRDSFRDDNLVTLCAKCHVAHDGKFGRAKTPLSMSARDESRRRAKVLTLFRSTVAERRWRGPGELARRLAKEGHADPLADL